MLKKVLIIAATATLALVIFGAGFAFAQNSVASAAAFPSWNAQGGTFPGGMMGGRWADGDMMGGYGGYGAMHNYVEQALAAKLNLTEAQIDEQEAVGKTFSQIALDNGVAEADLTAFFTEIHTAAFDKAVADGVLTREQADLMLQNMAANGFDQACPVNGAQPQDGSGYRHGRGGMMGGGYRWNVTPTPAP